MSQEGVERVPACLSWKWSEERTFEWIASSMRVGTENRNASLPDFISAQLDSCYLSRLAYHTLLEAQNLHLSSIFTSA